MGIELYVGVDDSNHAGTNIKGELALATFSLLYDDSVVHPFKNGREYTKALDWMSEQPNPARDFRFTLLLDEKWRHSSSNLVYVSPPLVRAYLKDNPTLKIDTLKLFIDGVISSTHKRYLRSEFKDFKHFVVANFIKKRRVLNGRTSKRPRCPTVVYMADVWARMVLENKTSDLLQHPKFVSPPVGL